MAKKFLRLAFALLLLCALPALSEGRRLVLPADTLIIDQDAFMGTGYYDEIALPYGAQQIYSGAFADTTIRQIYLPESLNYIAEDAFGHVYSASVFPGSYAHDYCKDHGISYTYAQPGAPSDEGYIYRLDYDYDFNNPTAVITDYVGENTFLWLPETVNGYPVTRVALKNFTCKDRITEIYNCSLADMASNDFDYGDSIPADFFSGFTALETISFSSSISSIGDRAFAGCTALKNFYFDETTYSIGEAAFKGCTSLQNFYIPEGLRIIGNSAFEGCTSLTSFYIYHTPEYEYSDYARLRIGNSAFKGCTALESISVEMYMQSEYTSMSSPFVEIGESAFENCTALKTLYLDGSAGWNNYGPSIGFVLGNAAFRGCTALESAEFYSCPSVGDETFKNCTSLQSFSADYALTLGKAAFENCTSLTTLDVDSISVSERTFAGCTALESIQLYSSSIPASAFEGCTALKSVVIPDADIEIGGNWAHYSYIGQRAFAGCTSLFDLRIPISSIGAQAFENCASLEHLLLPVPDMSVEADAFSGCDKLTVYVPESGADAEFLTQTGVNFETCPNQYTITPLTADTCRIKNCERIEAYIDVPNAFGAYTVTELSGWFRRDPWYGTVYDSPTQTRLPDNITLIHDSALDYSIGKLMITPNSATFRSVLAYEKAEYPNSTSHSFTFVAPAAPDFLLYYWESSSGESVARILYYFGDEKIVTPPSEVNGLKIDEISSSYWQSWPLLDELRIPADVPLADCGILGGWTGPDRGPRKITFLGDIDTLHDRVFYQCTALEEVEFCGNVGTITADGLSGTYCPKILTFSKDLDSFVSAPPQRLEQVYFGGNVSSIGSSAFSNCSNLTDVSFAGNVGSIGDRAFYDLDGLTQLTFGHVGSIGDRAFYSCDNLAAVSFAGNVGSIGSKTFDSCKALTSVTFAGDVGSIGDSAFYNRDGLTQLTFGHVGSIGDSAFYSCDNLAAVTFESNVDSIGNNAFAECKALCELILPKKINSIGSYAFYNCDKLTDISIPDGWTTLPSRIFYTPSYGSSSNQRTQRVWIPASVTEIASDAFRTTSYFHLNVYCPKYSAADNVFSGQYYTTVYHTNDQTFADYGVLLIDGSKQLPIGACETLQLTVFPQTDWSSLQWQSSDPDVLSVTQDGTITALTQGTATITANISGAVGSLTVSIYDPVTDFALSDAEITIPVYQNRQLSIVDMLPAGSTEPPVWASASPQVADVSYDGTIYAYAIGDTQITCEFSGVSRTCTVHVVEPEWEPVTNFTLSDSYLWLTTGTQHRIEILNIKPSDATEPPTWTSSNPEIAEVSADGTITAKSVGQTYISCSFLQCSRSIQVEVTLPEVME